MLAVIVWIGPHTKTGVGEDCDMICPCGVGNPDGSLRLCRGQQARKHAQRPSAGGLQAADAVVRAVLAEGDFGDHRRERGVSARADIGFRRPALQQAFLGCPDRSHDRCPPSFVTIDTDPEVELLRPVIGPEEAAEREDGVGGGCCSNSNMVHLSALLTDERRALYCAAGDGTDLVDLFVRDGEGRQHAQHLVSGDDGVSNPISRTNLATGEPDGGI